MKLSGSVSTEFSDKQKSPEVQPDVTSSANKPPTKNYTARDKIKSPNKPHLKTTAVGLRCCAIARSHLCIFERNNWIQKRGKLSRLFAAATTKFIIIKSRNTHKPEKPQRVDTTTNRGRRVCPIPTISNPQTGIVLIRNLEIIFKKGSIRHNNSDDWLQQKTQNVSLPLANFYMCPKTTGAGRVSVELDS